MKKIAACYIRVSTDDQLELSPDSQLFEIRKYAEVNGYYIPDEYVFKDEGISGRSATKRPEFNRMISVAKSKPKPFDALLLWKFSRFARNRTDAVVYKNLLRNQCGIDVISISENIGDDKGTSVILEAMFEAMDEYYSINLSTEVKRSMQLKAERGEPICKAPFGYKNENKAYVIDEEQAHAVRMMFDLYESGVGMKAIAVRLGDMGVRTLRGNLPDNRWVEYVLTNPVYTGKIRWTADGRESNRKRYKDCDFNVSPGKHEPIVSEEQFNHVAELISDQKKRYARYQRTEAANGWVLRGLVRCSCCGATLIRAGLSTKYPFLQCHKYNRGQCNQSHYISEAKMNRLVISYLERAAAYMDFELVRPNQRSKGQSETAAIKKMIESETRKLTKVKEAYEAGVDTLTEYRESKQRIQANIINLESQLTSKPTPIDKPAFSRKIIDVLEVLKNPTVEPTVKNNALRSVVHEIVYEKAKGEIRILFYA